MPGHDPPRRDTRHRLSAAYTHLRTPSPPTTRPDTGAQPIIDRTDTPFDSVEDAATRLEQLATIFDDRDDGRGVFLTLYAAVTDRLGTEIDAGTFENPQWVTDYLVGFANHYRHALYHYETGALTGVPDPWQLAFDAANQPHTHAIQDVLLGINAHINYDLAYALTDAGITDDQPTKLRDHRRVTDILATLVDPTQTTLAHDYDPGIDDIDTALGRLDEHVTTYSLANCRDSAWRNAVAMTSSLPLRPRVARWLTHATATGIAHLIQSAEASMTIDAALQNTAPDHP